MRRNRRPPRLSAGNVAYLRAPQLQPAAAWPWMAWHAEWWETAAQALDWQPIGLYRPFMDEGLAIASPVLLRDKTRWLYGSRVDLEWRRFTEGGSYALEDFAPTRWAEPSLDDTVLLSRD